MTNFTAFPRWRGFLLALALMLALPLQAADLQSGDYPAEQPAAEHQRLRERLAETPRLPVIVRLRPDAALSTATDPETRRARLAALQDRVLARLSFMRGRDLSERGLKRFSHVAGFALQLDAFELDELLADVEVLDVIEDRAHPPLLAESLPLIGADPDGSFRGYGGAGQVVAVLDTGVQSNHPFLAGKVVAEACFSTEIPTQGVSSVCPGGSTASTAPGSGAPCRGDLFGCTHGTHVAGIVAGEDANSNGVAPDASLISIQVFSAFPAAVCDGEPCAMAFDSDILRGLEQVLDWSERFPIASVNLSLGGGSYSGDCDNDPRKPVIDALRARGIATVISSGNAGESNAMCMPACISSAISVGSSTETDAISWFSNRSRHTDLFAPGSDIRSSVPINTFDVYSGTSMAAPHVAGAWAVLKSAVPEAQVEQILWLLRATGESLYDADTGRRYPRIDLDSALDWCAGMPSCAALMR